ncbi:MAG: hypothetical protein WKF47_06570 [Geodermatophilaceae bacterium]
MVFESASLTGVKLGGALLRRQSTRAPCVRPCSAAAVTMNLAMTVLDKLERRIGFIAIPGLMRIVVMFTALVCRAGLHESRLLCRARPRPELHQARRSLASHHLHLHSDVADAAGRMLSPLWAVRGALVSLVHRRRARAGMGSIPADALFPRRNDRHNDRGVRSSARSFRMRMLAASLFFAFAWFYPDEVIYVIFILPDEDQMARLDLRRVSRRRLRQRITNAYRDGAARWRSANYFIFFGPEILHQVRHRKDVAARRERFEVQTRSADEPLHRCATCGATELS